MPLLTVNGTELYYELRGGGPPVLLIMGFTGDGGNFKTGITKFATFHQLTSGYRGG